MLQPFHQPARSSSERVESWTRDRFDLSSDTLVVVADVHCQVPGCPPRETLVAFWQPGGLRYRYKVFKPVADVVESDIPVKWLLPSLEDLAGLGCECC